MAHLDVIVIDAQTFSKAALIQIAGRVGRKHMHLMAWYCIYIKA